MPKVTRAVSRAAASTAALSLPQEHGLVADEMVGGEDDDDGLGVLEPDARRRQHEGRGRVAGLGLDEEARLGSLGRSLAGLAGLGGVGDERHLPRRDEGPDAPDRLEEHRVGPGDAQELLRPGGPAERPEAGPPPPGQDHGADVPRLHDAPSLLMTCWRMPRTSFWIAARSSSVSASKRRTMTAWVFEARTSPQPLGKMARTPSMSMTG